jgi:hypothetical protein
MGVFDFLSIRKSVDSLQGQLAGLRSQAEGLKREREELHLAPATKDDVIAAFCARIDEVGATYPADLKRAAGVYFAGREIPSLKTQPLGFLMPQANHGMNSAAVVASLAFLLRDDMKAGIARAINALDWPAGAVSLAERSKRLSKLDADIARLESEENSLREHASRAGIVI